MIPIILGHTPAGASVKQLVHYGQEFKSEHFRQFDYGYIENMERYKSWHPPDYDIKNIKSPIALYYAADDWLAAPKDIVRLASELPNMVGSHYVPHKSFNHFDFVWGKDVRRLIYDNIVDEMKRADNNSQ